MITQRGNYFNILISFGEKKKKKRATSQLHKIFHGQVVEIMAKVFLFFFSPPLDRKEKILQNIRREEITPKDFNPGNQKMLKSKTDNIGEWKNEIGR